MDFFNHPNWTSIAQVMGSFSGTTIGSPILTLHTVRNLGLVFGWETKGIWNVFFMEVVAASVNLMLGF